MTELLPHLRVIDLADDRGIFCARILGDMGADVIKIEPPTGDPARRIGPFFHDEPGIENSLYWQAYAANKRSVTLDIEQAEGRELLLRLVRDADFLVESFRPGYLAGLGLAYDDLKAANPELIYVSISPFGQDGPYSGMEATDLTGAALGGFMWLTGDDDRPPLRVSVSQFWALGAASAATGAMIAYWQRATTGRGQHVDSSCQQAMARTLSQAPWFWDAEQTILQRSGPYRPVGRGRRLRINFPCADGYVNFILPGGSIAARSMAALCAWMADEGEPDPILSSTDFAQYGFGMWPDEVIEALDKALTHFFASRTKRALADEALERRVLLFPVNDPADIYAYPQLEGRGYFRDVEAPDGGTLKTLGPWARLSATPMEVKRRAPRLGEHTGDALSGIGVGDIEQARLKREGVI